MSTPEDSTLRYCNRRASAATWTSLNPVLLAGELGIEKDTDRFKIGDGVTAWNDLPYYESAALILTAAALLFAPLNDPPFATVDRPDPVEAGAGGRYYDTTLGKPAWSDGTDWRDAAGTVI